VQEHSSAVKGGKVVENLGHYLPTTPNKETKIDVERAKYWLSVGAQPSDSVAVLLKKEGVPGIEKYILPRDKKRKKKNAVEEEQVKTAPAAPKEEAKKEEAKI